MKTTAKKVLSLCLVFMLFVGIIPMTSGTASAAYTVYTNSSYSPVQSNAQDGQMPTANNSFYYYDTAYLNLQTDTNVFLYYAKVNIYRNGSYYNSYEYIPKANHYFRWWCQAIQLKQLGNYSFYYELRYANDSAVNQKQTMTTTERYFTVSDRTPSVRSSASTINIDMRDSRQKTVFFWPDQDVSYRYKISFDEHDSTAYSCEWGEWTTDNKAPLTITANRVASNQKLTVSILRSDNGAVVSSRDYYVNISGQTYTVSYDANGGNNAPASQTKTTGNSITLTNATPSRSGYAFVTWATRPNGGGNQYAPGATYSRDADVTLYAIWKQNTFSVTYNANGGTGAPGKQTGTSGEPLVVSSTTPKKNMTLTYDANGGEVSETSKSLSATFKEWNVQKNGKGAGYAPGSNLRSTEDVTLYAQWTDPKAGTLPTPIGDGMSFIGWYTLPENGSRVTASTTITESMTLFAHWNANRYTIEFYDNDTLLGTKQMRCGETGTLSYGEVPSKANHYFVGWTIMKGGPALFKNGESIKNLTKEDGGVVKFYAVWNEAKTYSVSYDANGGYNAPADQIKTEKTDLKLSEKVPSKFFIIVLDPNNGGYESGYTVDCTFVNWATYSNGSGTIYAPGATYKNDADIKLYAKWSNPKFGKLPTPEKDGYIFAGWYTAIEGGSRVTENTTVSDAMINEYGDMTLYAHWRERKSYSVTYDANGGTGAPSAQAKYEGLDLKLSEIQPTKKVTITYDPNGGRVSQKKKTNTSTFLYWSDSGEDKYFPGDTYSKDAALSLKAVWLNVAIHPTPIREGYDFLGWFTEKDGGTPVATFGLVSKDTTLYAHWEMKKMTLSMNERYGFGNSHKPLTGHYKKSEFDGGPCIVEGCCRKMKESDLRKLERYINSYYSDKPKKAQSTLNSVVAYQQKPWSGSCYGMATTAILSRTGQIDIQNFDFDAKNLHDADQPYLNENVQSAINYYHVSQNISFSKPDKTYYRSESDWSDGLRELVKTAQSGYMMTFGYSILGSGGHRIVVTGYTKNADGSHRLLAYDNRYPSVDTPIDISADYQSCVVDNCEIATRVSFATDFSTLDLIDIDGPNNDMVCNYDISKDAVVAQAEGESETTELYVTINGDVTITNSQGKTLLIRDGEESGTMEILDSYFICNDGEDGTPVPITMVYTVKNSSRFTLSSDADALDAAVLNSDIYASVNAENADNAVVDIKSGVTVNGENVDGQVYLSLNNDVCDMISVEGSAEKQMTLTYKDDGVLVGGMDAGENTLTVFSNTVDIEEIPFGTEKDTVFVTGAKNGETGEVELLVSEKDNGKYEQSIMATESELKPGIDDPQNQDQPALNVASLNLQYKATGKLTETTGCSVTWTSSDANIVAVDQNGNLTAKRKGTATITATAANGNSASCKVTVNYAWWQWLIKILLFGWIWY